MAPEASAHSVDEQLSAWLDDELPAHEAELLATRLVRSDDLRRRGARYGLIGAVLQGSDAFLPALSLAERVSAELERTMPTSGIPPAATPTGDGDRRRGLREFLPYAAAAGLAFVTVLMLPGPRTISDIAGSGALTPEAASITSPDASRRESSGSPEPATRFAGLETERQASNGRLTSYLVYHGEYSGMLSAKVVDSHIVNARPYAVTAASSTESAAK